MIRDRGTIKWTAMMLPEHVQNLKEILVDENKIEKTELDEQTIIEFELIICEAMEFNKPLLFEVFENGLVKRITGTVHFINYLEQQLAVEDKNGTFQYLPFSNLISVQQE